jgi:hypothetical protein
MYLGRFIRRSLHIQERRPAVEFLVSKLRTAAARVLEMRRAP